MSGIICAAPNPMPRDVFCFRASIHSCSFANASWYAVNQVSSRDGGDNKSISALSCLTSRVAFAACFLALAFSRFFLFASAFFAAASALASDRT